MTTQDPPALVLGSSSPRRRDLLGRLGLGFRIVNPEVEEVRRPDESPKDYVLRNAREKAAWVRGREPRRSSAVVISADTIVTLQGSVLEKPTDHEHACHMLRQLSGRTHTVISGVCVTGGDAPGDRAFTVQTDVSLKQLSEAEIAYYLATGEPLDKAGGYAAQGVGSYMVEAINGSYTNVVGLPMAETVEVLEKDFGCSLWDRVPSESEKDASPL